jgi:hypothetical protein
MGRLPKRCATKPRGEGKACRIGGRRGGAIPTECQIPDKVEIQIVMMRSIRDAGLHANKAVIPS